MITINQSVFFFFLRKILNNFEKFTRFSQIKNLIFFSNTFAKQYDNEYFMDHGSASCWECPFQSAHSTQYIVARGRVSWNKEDHYGVILELQRGVPYDDYKMREATKNIARSWRNIQVIYFLKYKFYI